MTSNLLWILCRNIKPIINVFILDSSPCWPSCWFKFTRSHDLVFSSESQRFLWTRFW